MRSPSSRSLAVPINVTGSPPRKPAPSAGAASVTDGGVLMGGGCMTVTTTCDEADCPRLSVTEAVTVCVPSLSTAVTAAPVPRGPSRSECHAMALSRLTSSRLATAVACNVTGSPT